ncbi:MAG: hypothetical protein V2A65_02965 [Candidatus Omnitrophota bacterium]
MNQKKLYEELKVIEKLLGIVNSEEEYKFLLQRKGEILSLLSFSFNNLKGGIR